jgi:plasmid maintenance system killer protein
MEWRIFEHRAIVKLIRNHKLPLEILREYTVWKAIVSKSGPYALRGFPGYHDEALRGPRRGQRSSRLNLQFRIVYEIFEQHVCVNVIEITPHKY